MAIPYMPILLTQSSNFIIGPIASILGIIMNFIFDLVHSLTPVGSLGVSIILFTVIVRLLMLPLMINQQKSMKRMQEVQPQLKKIQDKYKNKKDPEAQKKMQEELGEFYKKNKVNPLGGCLPLIIQMPIFFALFAVLRNAPAYIDQLREMYTQIATFIQGMPNYNEILQPLIEGNKAIRIDTSQLSEMNVMIDLLSKFTTANWVALQEATKVPDSIITLIDELKNMNFFLGINLTDTPNTFPGIILPVIAGLTTYLSSKTMSSANSQANQGNEQAMQTQKTMTTIFPFLTAFMTYTLPAGMGLYWITSNTFQIVQQLALNNQIGPKKGKEAK